MKILSTIFFFILLSVGLIFGQSKEVSRLIDEFGEINSEDLTARLDNFFVPLKQNSTLKGYIIIYRDKNLPFGFPVRFATQLRFYLVGRGLLSINLKL